MPDGRHFTCAAIHGNCCKLCIGVRHVRRTRRSPQGVLFAVNVAQVKADICANQIADNNLPSIICVGHGWFSGNYRRTGSKSPRPGHALKSTKRFVGNVDASSMVVEDGAMLVRKMQIGAWTDTNRRRSGKLERWGDCQCFIRG